MQHKKITIELTFSEKQKKGTPGDNTIFPVQ